MTVSEALFQYARPPIPPDAVCVACGGTRRLGHDHCHEHGWVRGIVCDRCNKWLARIDRRVAPRVDEELRASLLAVRNRCPDCEPLEVTDLKCRVSWDAGRVTLAASPDTRTILTGEAREHLRGLLDEVEHDDVHVTILRWDKPAAVMVSPEWYEQAKALVAASAAGQTEHQGEK